MIITYVWNLTYDTNKLLLKQKHTNIEKRLVVASGERGRGRAKIGVEDKEIQTTMCKINKL